MRSGSSWKIIAQIQKNVIAMKREEPNLRELVEPDQDAGSSARVQRRESSTTETDPDGYRWSFGDPLDIPHTHADLTRKGRHMQRIRNIPVEGPEGTGTRFRTRPGKGTRREKQKEKGKDRGKKRDYYEYRDWRDKDEFTWKNEEDACSRGFDRDECNQGKDLDACSQGYAEYAYMKEKDRDECTRINERDRGTRARRGVGTSGCSWGNDEYTQKIDKDDHHEKRSSRDRKMQEVPS